MTEKRHELLEANDEDIWSAKHAKHYDKSVRGRFAIYPELHRLVRHSLVHSLPARSKILMLGCGSGEEIVQAASAMPDLSIVGVDTSKDMLSFAKRKVQDAQIEDRCELIHNYLSDSPKVQYDGSTAILVSHFMPDNESPQSRRACAQELFKRLKPGAPLIVANVLGTPGEAQFEREYKMWKELVLSTVDDVQRWEENFDSIRTMVQWVSEDRELEIWNEAGFEVHAFLMRWLAVRVWLFRKKKC